MSETARKRCCGNCIFSERPKGRWLRAILSRWPGLLICFRCAKGPGEMCEVAATDVCENFREQTARPLRVEPPEPPGEDIRYIPLTKGKHAIVDAADYERLIQHKWYANIGPDGKHA